MKAIDIKIGRAYRIVDQSANREKAKVLKEVDKSTLENSRRFLVEFVNLPESVPAGQRTAIIPSRKFHREWGESDDQRIASRLKFQQEQQELHEEAEATEQELIKAGFNASVRATMGREDETWHLTFKNRDSFDRMLQLLMEKTANA